MSMCRVFPCIVGSGCLLWPVYSLGKTLLSFDLLHFVHQGQIFLLLQVSLDFLLLHFSTYNEEDFFCCCSLVLEGVVGLHRTAQLQLLRHYWSEQRLGLLLYWMACLGTEQRSFCCFWDCIKYSILDYVYCDGYFISSKGFLLTVVDIMVIWVKISPSSPFEFANGRTVQKRSSRPR